MNKLLKINLDPIKHAKPLASPINEDTSIDEKSDVIKEFHKKGHERRKNKISQLSKHVLDKLSVKSFHSVFMAILQVINCTIKYTLISIPFGIKVLGIINGSMIHAIIGCMSIYSVFLLLKVKESVEKIDKHLHA